MFLKQEEQPNIDGLSLGEFVSETIDNYVHGGFQAFWAVVGFFIVFGLALAAKMKKLAGLLAFGGLWGGWLAVNTYRGTDTPLFPGTVQASRIWDVVFVDAAAAVMAFMAVAIVWLWARDSKLIEKLAMSVAAVLVASFIYNMLESYNG